jgi:ribosomal protein S15P/S13E
MALSSEKTGEILSQFRRGPGTPAPRSQVALLSERINSLGERFQCTQGRSTRPGVKLVNQRRKLLDYLRDPAGSTEELSSAWAFAAETPRPPSPTRGLLFSLSPKFTFSED